MSKTPEEVSKEVEERIKLAGAAAQQQVEEGAKSSAASLPPASAPSSTANLTAEQIEQMIEQVLGTKAKEARAAKLDAEFNAKPPEPNWAFLTEREALDISNPLSIPVIEHEVPAYMDIRIADPEYLVVWANRDQRRLGQLLAEGYEFLKKEHIASDFPLPLKFDSEGMYTYQDVIAMRVHKRIILGKRRRVVEQSYAQLRGPQALAKAKLAKTISSDPHLEEAFESGSLGYYEPSESVK